MGVLKQMDMTPETIAEHRKRYLAYTENLMMVVIDFEDGPTSEPDPPHAHPHEQITYVVAGEVNFFLDGEPTHLVPGDVVTIPPNIEHSIQPLTKHLRLLDAFHPLRQDFIT
jgi:quercetin dioxygenase-like cupin family protein